MKELSIINTVSRLSANAAPVLYVDAGETIVVSTKDCFADKVLTPKDALSDIPWDEINPCTGPIYINNAVPGDVLKISIERIELNEKGIMLVDREYLKKYDVEETNRSIHVRILNNEVILDSDHRIPVSPMIGSIGVAPLEQSMATTLPGTHGGNMDCTCICEGSELFLPVFHDGALLALGDLHAVMGDGEFTDCGVEAAGKVTLSVDILKQADLPVPMVITKESVAMIASAKSLDDAVETASDMMLKHLLNHYHMSFDLAWGIMCTSANIRVCQFVNAIKTVRCEIKKDILNGHR